ncbi:MAG: hypothetical protein ABIL77_01665 [candidate division WOR-3 bacterium]
MSSSYKKTVIGSGELDAMTILSIAVVLIITAITFLIGAGIIKKKNKEA